MIPAISSLALADSTGDGLLDIFFGVRGGRQQGVHLLVNDRANNPEDPFANSQQVTSGNIRGLAVGKLNDDDVPDLVTLDAERYLVRTYFGNTGDADPEG